MRSGVDGVLTRGNSQEASTTRGVETTPRLIAIYLPQFHPIPENDAWWGRGFTEWRNVVAAKPLFPGHYQPQLPADLGFYDLRLPETREAQAALARRYGIHGFCYYHYWFNGRRILERPFNEVLASGRPDFPFCLAWANENWTRRWDGQDQDVLLQQVYTPEDDIAHIRSLVTAFQDPRYIRVDGKPLFLVYRVTSLPDPAATARRWREEAARRGLPGLYLCTMTSLPSLHFDPASIGFDAAVDFQPDWGCLPIGERMPWWRRITPAQRREFFTFDRNYVRTYPDMVERVMARREPQYTFFPGVTPGWDNSARRKTDANIFKHSRPEDYGRWLRHAVEVSTRRYSGDDRLVFINAWNEWAEGNHLEPDQRWGHAYLEQTLASIGGRSR
jgi:lipopolysaccharide biosynthesis protein